MKTVSPFRDLSPEAARVELRVNGQELRLPRGMTLAAALLAAGVMPFRQTPVSGAPRGLFCMMGTCYDCLVEIGGETRQACMIEVTEGLDITLPTGRVP